jgi:hypothetical protein
MRLSFRHDIKLLSFQISTVQPVEQTSEDGPDDVGGGMIAAITISCIGAACLLLLAVLWVSTFLGTYVPVFIVHSSVLTFYE